AAGGGPGAGPAAPPAPSVAAPAVQAIAPWRAQPSLRPRAHTKSQPRAPRTSPRLASAQQDIVSRSHRVEMEQPSLSDHVADDAVKGRKDCLRQILSALAAQLLHPIKAPAGLDQVGQKHNLLQPGHARTTRRMVANGRQNFLVPDAELPAGDLGADDAVPQSRFPGR